MFTFLYLRVLKTSKLNIMTAIKKQVTKKLNVQNAKASEKKEVKPVQEKNDIFEAMKKDEIKKESQALIQSFQPTAEERIKNAEKFTILTKKYDHLKAKKEELEKFKISSDGTKERIFFENAEGYKLEVSNSNIVNDMLALAENTLSNILNDTKKQVQEFVI